MVKIKKEERIKTENIFVILVMLLISLRISALTTETKEEMIELFNSTSVLDNIETILSLQEGDDSNHISWGVSDAINGLLRMYEVTREDYYLEKSCDYIQEIIEMRDIERAVTTFTDSLGQRHTHGLWRATVNTEYYYYHSRDKDIKFPSMPAEWEWLTYDEWKEYWPNIDEEIFAYPFMVCNGMIVKPLAELCLIAEREGKWEMLGSNRDKIIRDTLINVINEVLDFYEKTYIDSHYIFDTDNMWNLKVFSSDTFRTPDTQKVTCPMNQQYILGQVFVLMFQLTGDTIYIERSKELCNYMKKFIYEKSDCYIWNYYCDTYNPGDRAEDISHAVLDLEFAYKLYGADSSIFDGDDLRKFSNTFTEIMFTGRADMDLEDTVYDIWPLVDGTIYDDILLNSSRSRGNLWLFLTKWSPELYEIGYNICSKSSYNGLACLLRYYDDYEPAEISLSKPNVTYNSDDYIEIYVSEIKMLGIFKYAVYQENGDTFTKGGIAGKDVEDHIIQVNDLRTKSAEDIVFKYWSDNKGILGPSREVVIPVVGKTLYVSHRDEIPVLKLEDITVLVQSKQIPDPYPDVNKYYGLPGCTIDVYYSGGIIERGITNSLGVVEWINKNIDNTTPLKVIAYKDGYFPDTSYIEPYMWSSVNEATGRNNGNHIFRDNLTKSIYITYTDGDKVIYGEKDSLSSGFDLIVAGEGDGSVLGYNSRRNIKILLWKNSSNYLSAWFNSPIEETDTLKFPALSVYEPSLMYNSIKGYMSGAGIVYRYLGDEAGDLIYDSFFIYPEDPTVLIPYTGEQDISGNLIKVKNNQSISFYNQYVNATTALSPIITYISTNNECAIKTFNFVTSSWRPSLIVSQTGNTASNSTVWKDGDTTRVVWENLGADGKQYVIQKKIFAGGEIVKLDTIEDNAYNVKARDHRIYTYVKDNSVCLKQFVNAGNLERTIAEGEDSIFVPDFDITYSPKVVKTRIYSIWTEKKDDEYRINYFEDSIGALANVPLYASELTSTEITMTESSIYDYVTGKFPVEKMNYDIAGLQQDHYYEVSVITSDKNPHIPQIVKIDGEVIGVVYGGKGEDTTKVMVPNEYYEDGYLSIELERKVGKDARVARVECYEYDEVDSETLTQLGKGNRIKLNEETKKNVVSNMVENGLIAYEVTESGAGEIEVIDITGRVVKESKVKSIKGINTYSVKELPAGIYFIRTDNTTNKLRKIIKLK